MNYEEMAVVAVLNNLTHLSQIMQREIDDARALLERANGAEPSAALKHGRPRLAASVRALVAEAEAKGRGSSWQGMSAEERSAEMARRRAVGAARQAAAADVDRLHPRDPRSPRHEAWITKLRKIQKKRWTAMTPKMQKAQLAKMHGAAA